MYKWFILAIWKALESAKDGKKLNLLCIVDQSHEWSVVVLDNFRNFKVKWGGGSKMRREYSSREKEIIQNLKKEN